MNQIYRSAGLIVVGVGAFAWMSMQSEKNFERAVEHYNLNPAQIEFARSCKSSLSVHDKEFRGGASDSTGCACIASTMASSETAGQAIDYLKMGLAFDSVVEFSEEDNSKAVDIMGLVTELTTKHSLTYGETMLAVTELGIATDVCNDARLPKTSSPNAVGVSTAKQPYQPTVTDAPSNSKGCEGLSASSVATLQQIADRDGKTLEQVCASVIS
ncbi:MAG: hypothetical protein AAFV37_11850 [Pseudomonadota bacterium]